MARFSVKDDRVSKLLSESLIHLYIRYGSVNALCDALNENLPAQGNQLKIYPNRIHSLFTDDPLKFINESTLLSVEEAIIGVRLADLKEDSKYKENFSRLRGDVAGRWDFKRSSTLTVKQVADELLIPPAVVNYMLDDIGAQTGRDESCIKGVSPLDTGLPCGQPDWSFQQIAHQRCMWALSKDLNIKVGLVVPTGGGKTRIALRIALSELGKSSEQDSIVLWVTHRTNLKEQARRELQKMLIEGVPDLPEFAAKMLATRVVFVMVSTLKTYLDVEQKAPILVIVDEGHHAAAESYKPIFETSYPLRGLFLTATPNRTDDLPIGIDTVAYTTTYKELHDRGVILIPDFEDFPVADFEWDDKTLTDLADKIIERARTDFIKTLVLAPRVQRVQEFYYALLEKLDEESDHVLSHDDIGFIHGTKNSMGTSNEEFIAYFDRKPRAIIVTAQLLLEGFDDPAINCVVVTYASTSLINLMQGAGRCVRYYPGKTKAYVLQAKNANLAYHFDQRWLYKEISDELRPMLEDHFYIDLDSLKTTIKNILRLHNVNEAELETIMSELEDVQTGSTCRIMLSGLPYLKNKDEFYENSEWSAILETDKTSYELRWIFNDFCARGAQTSDPSPLLHQYSSKFGFRKSFVQTSSWFKYSTMLLSMIHVPCEEGNFWRWV
jgi:superfamily II DNA or RNA helicase